ncbi:hypothetical protein [Streptomyces phaeolivaceus]|uniref:hypothetical protein n=1 Tax=Streptomyces phaeolivaceus TaxID=2653200 RepID=UPI00384DC1E1
MTAKIRIVTGDAAESLEVLYPYQRLREEGYEVHVAAPRVCRSDHAGFGSRCLVTAGERGVVRAAARRRRASTRWGYLPLERSREWGSRRVTTTRLGVPHALEAVRECVPRPAAQA